MPIFACYCRDSDNAAILREQWMQAHLAHVEAHIETYAVAGPLMEEGSAVGSLLVLKACHAAAAHAFLEQDPYHRAGVWASVEITEFRGVAGDWVGGAAWKH